MRSEDGTTFAFKPFAEWICDLLDIRSGEKVLDVGCGRGIASFTALERVLPNGSVTGVDVDANLVAQLEKEHRGSVEFHVCSAENLDEHFREETFDAVISNYSFHLFRDREKALKQMIRLLRTGGRLGITVPGPKHVKEFREVLMRLLKKFNLQRNFMGEGALVMSEENLGQLAKHYSQLIRHQILDKEIMINMGGVHEYLQHMEARSAKSRVLNRIPAPFRNGFWESLEFEMSSAYRPNQVPMTLHALALTAVKTTHDPNKE